MTTTMTVPFERELGTQPASLEEAHTIAQFLFMEALLLDERRFNEWFEMLADDLHYYAPTRTNRMTRERAKEWADVRGAAHFDDDKAFIGARIRRLSTNIAWSEDPPSRTRHVVSNVLARKRSDGSFEVDSNMIVYRGRADYDAEWFVGARHDVIRPAVDTVHGFQIVNRTILFDHTGIDANNLGIFF
jgi:3-phenylpropionate/cinnamic acid dioxygenase small subunit